MTLAAPSLLVPQIDDDATRRQFIALLGAAGLFTACGNNTPEQAAGPTTREFTHAFGTSTVPVAPQRIVTTTDQNALLPLLELGIKPVGSSGDTDPITGEGRFRRTEGFDTSGITAIGLDSVTDVEAVAALEPDLIVGYEFDTEFASLYARIAPFVGVQVFKRRLAEVLLDFGDLVGRADRARELQSAYDRRIEDLRPTLAQRHPNLTVSVLAAVEPGTFNIAAFGPSIGTVGSDLGLGRPAVLQDIDRITGDAPAGGSLELLGQYDADVVLVLDFSGDGGDRSPARELVTEPVWQQLEAARRGQLHVIDGSKTVGAAWARMGSYLDVLEDTLLADGVISTGVNG